MGRPSSRPCGVAWPATLPRSIYYPVNRSPAASRRHFRVLTATKMIQAARTTTAIASPNAPEAADARPPARVGELGLALDQRNLEQSREFITSFEALVPLVRLFEAEAERVAVADPSDRVDLGG